ncbi:MAG: hypothetical protein JXB14_01555 [Candidatus Altiarchaeota archaeon]|nr:hypothetical protein [Candidatus Altiarchaeota archaeon]
MAKKTDGPLKREIEEIKEAVFHSKDHQDEYEQNKQRLLDMSEISVILDTYDDIFSDFDPRTYSERQLSEDFLSEAKRMSKDRRVGKTDGVELTLLIPSKLKDPKEELVIEKRLHRHFQKHHNLLHKDVSKIKRRGALLVFFGMLMITVATFMYPMHGDSIPATLLIVIFEPAGWFTMWTGMDHIFHTWNNEKDDLDFYDKMAKCKISFLPY